MCSSDLAAVEGLRPRGRWAEPSQETPIRSRRSQVGIRQQRIAYQVEQLVVRADERSQRAHRRAERVEVGRGQAIGLVGPLEVREVASQLVHQALVHRVIDAGADLHERGVEAPLPDRWQGDDDVPTDQLGRASCRERV